MTSPQRSNLHRVRTLCGALWARLREVTRDDAYERYLTHHKAAHPGSPVLSAREFYVREQQRKWSGVSRCC